MHPVNDLMTHKPSSMKKVLILFFVLSPIVGCAQDNNLPLRITLGNEATAIPFSRVFTTPVHPAIQIGTEFEWRESEYFRLSPAVNIGYMFHKHLFQGAYINGELGFDYKTGFGLNLKSAFGLGYLRTFATQQEFQFKDGQYKDGEDTGNSRIMPSLSLGLGYDLDPSAVKSTELFVMYQSWLEYPYSPGFIPLMLHTTLHIGFKFYPF